MTKRPLSPHLTIYRPQITSVLSITHRISGVVLYLGFIILAWWIVFNVYGCSGCIDSLISSLVGKIILIGWTAALYYHLLNGVRHLFWDIGQGFDIKTVNSSGIWVLIGTVALTITTWLV